MIGTPLRDSVRGSGGRGYPTNIQKKLTELEEVVKEKEKRFLHSQVLGSEKP